MNRGGGAPTTAIATPHRQFGAIVSELVQAATDAVKAQLSWAAKIKIVQGIDKVHTGAGKMLPAACAMFILWILPPASLP